jgi:hypothetical protein
VLITDNEVGTPEKAWREACIDGREVSGSDNRENRGKTMTRVVRTLTAKGRIVVRDNTVFWPAPELEDWEAGAAGEPDMTGHEPDMTGCPDMDRTDGT